MKQIMSMICFITLVLSLCSCGGERIKYTIYSDFDLKSGIQSGALDISLPNNVELKSEGEIDFSPLNEEEIDPNDAAKTREVQISDFSYSVGLVKSYKNDLSNIERYKGQYSKYNKYRGQDATVELLENTDKIVFFSITNREDRTAEGNCTEDEAIHIAEETLNSLYGKEIAENYVQSKAIFSDSGTKTGYFIVFERKEDVFGILTDDYIEISVNKAGKIIAINARFMGVFDTAKEDISKKELENALDTLEKSIKGVWKIAEKRLVIDSKGDYYIRVYTLPDGENASDFPPPVLHINVK
ncbi:MAG: hypothetical protein IJW52_00740 [Clostridia bacterium]|nr:hypothetical protein [Clostridia bacterium]